MTVEPTKLSVQVNDSDKVTALLYFAEKKQRAGITLILGPGAGAGQTHPFMRLFARAMAERGIDCVTFDFLYMEQGRKAPDPKAKLEACYTAVIQAVTKEKRLAGNRLAIGGKSMGGRIGSQVAADSSQNLPISALVFLGYPLHPPGRPDQLRDAHLKLITAPMLFVQGARDAFGTPDELNVVINRDRLPATLYVVEGGDHSLKAPKKSGFTQEQVYQNIFDEIIRFLT
ncbi:MAG TPA: alpha/beta fold hydrolase [Pyrinomonadaceae bacterium]|nr:alpha/beta fold hydrolase [Pyrinomonadaceae bacterium]